MLDSPLPCSCQAGDGVGGRGQPAVFLTALWEFARAELSAPDKP